MKKILSLLSMLMITVTAFATSYTDKLTYKLTVLQTVTKELPAGELTVEHYGQNYTVTAKGCDFSEFEADNWYEIVCEDVPGTTDANGVTTITLDNPYALRTSDNAVFTDSKLVVKFNGTKAYAHFEGKMNVMFAPRAFEYTFGTNEGFESTGGGETGGGEPGGEDKPAIVDVVDAGYARNGTGFAFPFTINWETQKLVAKLDLSTCKSYNNNEGIITVGTDNGRGDVSLWNPNNGEANCHLYYTRYYYDYKTSTTNEKLLNLHYLENPSDEVVRVDKSLQNLEPGLVVFTFDKDGLHVGDNLIATPAQMTTLYNSTSLIFGSKEGATRSYATYKYVKVVPADWTETTEPEVTEVSSKSFEDKLYAFADGENIEQGNATVKISNMSDETIKMSLVFGDTTIESANIEQGTDDKGRTTYTGTADWEGVNFAVSAVVYTKDEAEKIYMTLTSNDAKYTVGTDPDYVAPEPPSIEGTVVEGSVDFAANGSKFEWSNIAINWNKQKLVAVIDLSSCTGNSENILSVGQNIDSWSIGGWHFYYTVASKKMKSDYLATDGAHPVSDPKTGVEPGTVRIELSKAEGCTIDGVSYNALYDSNVTGTWQSNTEDFWNLTSVNIGSKEGANRSNAVIKYVTVVDLPVTVKEEKTFNEVLYMNDQKVADATVVVKEMSDETVNMSLQFNGYEYTSTELVKGTDEKNRTTYTGKVSKDSQTYDVAGVVYEKDNAERLYMTMTDTGVTFVVGENPDAVTPEVTEVSNKTYTSNLRIFDGEEPVVENAEAQVNIIKYSDESYKVTLKDVTLNENTQDLVFVGTTPEEAPTAEAAEPLTINAKSDEATTTFFGKQVNGTFEITEVSDDEIKMEFAIEGEGVLYEGEFNYEAKTPAEEPFCKENYVADGNGFEWEFAVDWDTQKVVMSIDPSTCTGNCEDVIGLGAVPTAWVNTLHLYRTRDQKLQGYFQVPGGNNNNTDKFAETVPFLVEVSKAQGFVVNDEVKIAASEMSYLFTLPTVKMGTGEGANDKSRATYNYVKVVDKDWTKDPETGINATTVAEGEFEVFSVDGVKLSKLQKGLNIVRSADGKVKKVLVK